MNPFYPPVCQFPVANPFQFPIKKKNLMSCRLFSVCPPFLFYSFFCLIVFGCRGRGGEGSSKLATITITRPPLYQIPLPSPRPDELLILLEETGGKQTLVMVVCRIAGMQLSCVLLEGLRGVGGFPVTGPLGRVSTPTPPPVFSPAWCTMRLSGPQSPWTLVELYASFLAGPK